MGEYGSWRLHDRRCSRIYDVSFRTAVGHTSGYDIPDGCARVSPARRSPMSVLNRMILLLAFATMSVALAQDQPSIGYPSVAVALESLANDPAVQLRGEAGWTVADAEEGGNIVLWTFTSSIHVAHPAAIKRTVYREEDAVRLEMTVLCEAEQEACDALVTEFQKLNDSMRRRLEKPKESDSID